MANLRSSSTVGGRQIVDLDIVNEFIYQIQTGEAEDKMKKAEIQPITNFSEADHYIKTKSKNGIWQVNNGTGAPGYNYGTMCNFTQSSSRFQFYAPHKETENGSDVSALYFRTGWDWDLKPWERVATKSMLDRGLNTKFDKVGGDINGNINASGYILSNNSLKVTNAGSESLTMNVRDGISKFNTTGGVSEYFFDKRLKVNGEIFAGSNGANKVWHSGNFNPDNYISKFVTNLTRETDLNTILKTGFYMCDAATNAPSKIKNWSYIEVLQHNDNWVLQKIYSFDGLHIYSRVKENGTWKSWNAIGGGLSYTQNISAGNWSSVDGVYEMTITHNIGSENITSVMVTDSNKISQFTGFQVLSPTVVKVFNSANTAGKVVINAVS